MTSNRKRGTVHRGGHVFDSVIATCCHAPRNVRFCRTEATRAHARVRDVEGFSGLALLALSVFVLYFVIRLAVHHGIRDAAKGRTRDGSAAT